NYRVSTTWVPYGNRSPDASYTVFAGTTQVGTAQVDQRHAPGSFMENGIDWQDLGGPYDVANSTLVVRLSDVATPGTYLIADSVRIQRLGNMVSATGARAVVLNGTTALASGAATLDFGHADLGTPVSRTLSVLNTGGANLTLGAITVP